MAGVAVTGTKGAAGTLPRRAGDVLDLVIRGGRIVTSGGSSDADLGIRDGQVVQIGGELPQAEREIDATGLLVLPGGIDMHVHLSPAELDQGPPMWVDDFASGSRAAAAGGVTTVGNMCFPAPGETLIETMDRHERVALAQSIVDFVLHPVLLDASAPRLTEVRSLAVLRGSPERIDRPGDVRRDHLDQRRPPVRALPPQGHDRGRQRRRPARLEPDAVRVITAQEQFTNSDYTPYEGRSITGWPLLTVRRGEVLTESGRIVAPPGGGRRVRRRPVSSR